MHDALPPGHKVVIVDLGDDPLQAMAPPDPAVRSPREVIVAIRSASVGWVALLMTSGQYQHVAKSPYTPGLEYAGVVAWAGAEAGRRSRRARVSRRRQGPHRRPRRRRRLRQRRRRYLAREPALRPVRRALPRRRLAATPFVAHGKGGRGAPNANVLPTNLIMMKGLDVLGCPTVISTVHDPALRPPRLAQILRWAEAGQLRPHVSHRFALAGFRAAMHARWHGEVLGGCVLHP